MVDRALTIWSAARRLRNAAAHALLSGVGLVSRDRPISAHFIRVIRRVAADEVALIRKARPILGQDLADPRLSRYLHGYVVGTWSLGPKSLEYIRILVLQRRPGLAIEFGSGVSTLALAVAMRDSRSDLVRPLVVSLEQDELQAARTLDLLRQAGVADDVTIVVAPLERQLIEGISTVCYSISPSVKELIGDRRADLVLIDGPAAEAGARFGTLPLIRWHLRQGASYVLDDALRDGELAIARRWASLSYVHVDGIRLIEKGLLTGTITAPSWDLRDTGLHVKGKSRFERSEPGNVARFAVTRKS